jgi:hypothetical protein
MGQHRTERGGHVGEHGRGYEQVGGHGMRSAPKRVSYAMPRLPDG